jgi:hypothetical protein
MPPTLGGTRISRSLTAIVSAFAVSALTFVGVMPNVARSSAADLVTRTAQVTAKANAYTDRKHAKTSHANVGTVKVDRTRYASYFAFPAAALTSDEAFSVVTLSVRIKSASHASKGKLIVRQVVSGWSGGKLTYKSRPKLGAIIGTAKLKSKGTVTVTLNAAAATTYLTKGISLQLTRSSDAHLVKLAKSPVTLNLSVGDATAVAEARTRSTTTPTATATATASATATATASATTSTVPGLGAITNKPVFAHYFPPYPISLDNVDGASDYYASNYLQASGESSKFAAYGGLLRDRPLPRSAISGDYQLIDMKTEVTQAKSAGITGFAVDILTFTTTDRNWILVEKLLQASASVGSFKVMLQPDMSAMSDTTTAKFAAAMATLSKYDAAYRLSTGELVISPFLAENKTAAWYADALALLKSKYGVSAVLLPLFLDASNMTSFASISSGFANWGVRNTTTAASWTNWTAKAHALKKMWMEPVSIQDVRPTQQIYDEASNTETLAATWNRAIDQDADIVLLTTWNDYSESTSFAPSSDHGWAFLNLSHYYLTKFRTGTADISDEKVIISNRIQKAATPVSYSATMKLRSGSTSPRDKIEVVTLLNSAATVTVTIDGTDYTYTAAAGKYSKLFTLAEGTFTATVTRSGSTVATVTTKDAVSFDTTSQQDLSYHAVSS